MNSLVVDVAGNLAIMLLGSIGIRVVVGHWYCYYGRQTLFAISCYIITTAGVRMLGQFLPDFSPFEGRSVTAIVAVVWDVILVQVLIEHLLYHREVRNHDKASTAEPDR
jgi:hypothetical protein